MTYFFFCNNNINTKSIITQISRNVEAVKPPGSHHGANAPNLHPLSNIFTSKPQPHWRGCNHCRNPLQLSAPHTLLSPLLNRSKTPEFHRQKLPTLPPVANTLNMVSPRITLSLLENLSAIFFCFFNNFCFCVRHPSSNRLGAFKQTKKDHHFILAPC